MSRRTSEDLDVRIRRAWPIDYDTTSSSSAAQRMRARVDERIAQGAEPDASGLGAPVRRSNTSRGRQRMAAVLVGVVLVSSALVVGGLVAGRYGVQNQPGDVEFADEPVPGVADEPTARLPEDPDAHVRTAVAATRRIAADLTVREALRQWHNADGRNFPDVDAFVEQTAPDQESTALSAANGDWSYADRWNTQRSNTQQGGCATNTECVGEVRFVGGQYYERVYNERTWEHVVADDSGALSELVRDGLAIDGLVGATVFDGSTVVDLLERYDVGWAAVPDSSAGATRYRLADADKARQLAEELFIGRPLTRSEARDLEDVTAGEALTVHVWIDGETGLVHRVRSQRSAGDVANDVWVMRNDLTLTQEGGSLVETPEQATDVTLNEWCARDRPPIWRTAAAWTTVCDRQ